MESHQSVESPVVSKTLEVTWQVELSRSVEGPSVEPWRLEVLLGVKLRKELILLGWKE